MSDLTNKILDAIDIMADDKVSSVKFDKTVRAIIVESVDPSVGKYKVKYQNSTFFAYANDLKSYSKGSSVYIVIPSSSFESHPYIVGTVNKLGANYIDVLSPEDMLSEVGGNILTSNSTIGFCSYKSFDTNTNTQVLYEAGSNGNLINIDELGLSLYKDMSDTIMIGASFRTQLPSEQQVGGGNYGIRMTCEYYDAKYKDLASKQAVGSTRITREYELNVNKMIGQPYNLFNFTPQKTYFSFDTENFIRITKIEVFCSSFPLQKKGSGEEVQGTLSDDNLHFYVKGQEITAVNAPYYAINRKRWYQRNKETRIWEDVSDIFINDFKLNFYETLTEEELQTISLRVTYPYGSYFLTTDDEEKTKTLRADLRIKGRRVNYQEQSVHFYWFQKDLKVTNNSPGYNQYGGPGWRCLNPTYNLVTQEGTSVGYNPDIHEKVIEHKDCLGLKNIFKCVAIYRNSDGTSTQVSATGELTNQTKTDTGVSIVSTMGESFAFNMGKTTLRCLIEKEEKKRPQEPQYTNYNYYWGVGIDGDEVSLFKTVEKNNELPDIDIANAYHFATYECTVYERISDKEEVLFGSASITLTNGEPNGEYRLVLRDGSKVYKYNEYGVAPDSPSLDEHDRISIPALTFDIYDDEGRLIQMDNTEKVRMCEVLWIWPHPSGEKPTVAPSKTRGIYAPNTDGWPEKIQLYDILDPISGNSARKIWGVKNQAVLPYNINNMYDIDLAGEDNNIELEVLFKNQRLRAKTNFTFTKDGEQGTNGTPYVTRIVPRDYEQIVLRAGTFYGRKGNTYKSLGTAPLKVNDIFKVQIWNNENIPYIEDVNASTYKDKLTWSTSLQDRGITTGLTINKDNGIINIGNANNTPSNTTIKAKLEASFLSENTVSYFDSYPIDVMVDSNYRIAGGFREVNYKSDGSRSGYVKKPFTLEKYNIKTHIWEQVRRNGEDGIAWWTNWNTTDKPTSEGNAPNIKPRASYESINVDTWIKVYTTKIGENEKKEEIILSKTLVAYVPIDYHLDRYGLGAINDWDGNSIKLNNKGDNYILAPQVGAGQREDDGTFTGITIGKAFENGSKKIGLLGYGNGERSIFLNATDGSAEFGKSGVGRIYIKPDGNGTIGGSGMTIALGPNPSIKFATGYFEVDKNGYLTAKRGNIAGWEITDTQLKHGNNIYLDSSATGGSIMFKAGSHFSVAANGTIKASKGDIAGWNIEASYLEGGILRLNKDGSLDAVKKRGEKDATTIWEIDADGVATFKDIRITNDVSRTSGGRDKKLISFTAYDKDKKEEKETFSVNDSGRLYAQDVDVQGTVVAPYGEIGGWTISPGSISSGNFKLNSSGTVQLGSGFTVDKNSVTKSDGTHSGAASGFGMGSGKDNSLGGKGIDSNNGNWRQINIIGSLDAMGGKVQVSGKVTFGTETQTVTLWSETAYMSSLKYTLWKNAEILTGSGTSYNSGQTYP